MHIFQYRTEQLLPIDIKTAWSFFSSPANLTVITPDELDFKIITALDDEEIYEGMVIDYRVKPLLGIPVRWKTEICKVNRPFSFTDRQLKGPYKIWEHTHAFIEKDNGVLVTDEVKYQLPFGMIGSITHLLLVRRKIDKIFNYRRQVLHKIFVTHEHPVN